MYVTLDKQSEPSGRIWNSVVVSNERISSNWSPAPWILTALSRPSFTRLRFTGSVGIGGDRSGLCSVLATYTNMHGAVSHPDFPVLLTQFRLTWTTGPVYSCLPLTTYQSRAKRMTPPNIAEDQFIVAAVTGVASGQNEKNQIGARKQRAPMLTARPYLPSDHRRAGSGPPFRRYQTKQLMVIR